MTQSIIIASRDLFDSAERTTRDIKYFFRAGDNTGHHLADYRNRVIGQIENGLSVEDTELDRSLLD